MSSAAANLDSRTPQAWFEHIEKLEAENRRLREALEHLASPNHAIKATGADARAMADYASRTLEVK